MVDTLNDKPYAEAPQWYRDWEKTGLIAWMDKNGDGVIQYRVITSYSIHYTKLYELVHAEGRLEGDHVVDARPGLDAHEEIDDLIRAVARQDLLAGHADMLGDAGVQLRVAPAGVAEGLGGTVAQHLFHDGRDTQGVRNNFV